MPVTGTVNSNVCREHRCIKVRKCVKGKKMGQENEKYILTSKGLHNIIVQHEKRRNSIHQSPGVG